MTYRQRPHRVACPERCCVVGRDLDDYPPPNPALMGNQYPRPMFSVIEDVERTWMTIEYGKEAMARDVVLIEYGQVVDEWDWTRPNPNAHVAARELTAGAS